MAELTQERLKELLNYDAETGLFTWINNSPTGGKVKAGNIAGTNKLGYVAIGIGFKHYSAHRLVWLYCFGRFPSKCIDHINHDRKDNRLINLREVTLSENSHNQTRAHTRSKSQLLGVKLRPSGRYAATIGFEGKLIHIGTFDDPNEAHQAYLTKKREIHKGCTI